MLKNNPKLRIITLIIIFLILIQLISAYIFGFIAQKQLLCQFDNITHSPFIKVLSHQYRRGLFSSNETVKISLNNTAINKLIAILPHSTVARDIVETNYSISYTTHITHGFFAGIINGHFLPTIAFTNTKIIYPENLKKILSKFFNDKVPFTVNNIIYLNKSGRYTVSSPEFNYEEALSGVKVLWQGLKLNISYNSDFNKFNNTLEIPEFSFNAPSVGNILVQNFSYASKTQYSKNDIKVGDTILNLGLIKVLFKNNNSGFNLGSLLHSLTGIDSTEFLNNLDLINPSNFVLNKLSYIASSTDNGQYFSANSNIGFESLVTQNKNYGPMKLNLLIDHVLSKPFSQILDKVSGITTNNINTREYLIKILKEYFIPILINAPIIRLNNFELLTPSGKINLSGYITTKNFTAEDMLEPKYFFNKLLIDLYFQVPRDTLAYVLLLQTKYLLSAGNTEMDEQSTNALKKVVDILLNNQINTWTKKGYLINKNGILESYLHYEDGHIKLNSTTQVNK